MIQFHALARRATASHSFRPPLRSVRPSFLPMSPASSRSRSVGLRGTERANERTADLMWSSSAIRRRRPPRTRWLWLLPGSLLRSPFWLEDRRMNPATAELVMVTAKRGERESVSVSAVCWRSASPTKKKIDKTETTTRNFASLPFRSFSAVVMPLAQATIADD